MPVIDGKSGDVGMGTNFHNIVKGMVICMKKLKIGLIGLGGQGRAHAKGLMKQTGDFPGELVAVCDINPEKFGTVKQEFNISESKSEIGFESYHCYTDMDEMLAGEALDLVIIALPTYLHKEATVKFLRGGVHVLCEKPMALTVEDCEEMIRVSTQTGKKLMIGQCLRFWDEYVILKEMIDSGKYGKMRAGMFYRGGSTPMWSFENWYLHKDKGGGAIFDQHIHDVDMVQYLCGMPEAVSTSGKVIYEDTMYDTLCTNYLYKDGPVVFAHNDWTLSLPFAHGFRVNFESATLELNNTGLMLAEAGKKPEKLEFTRHSALLQETRYFIEVICGEHENTVNPPEASMETIRLVKAEIRSADHAAEPVKL